MSSYVKNSLVNVGVALAFTILMLGIGEIIIRYIDSYALFSIRLKPSESGSLLTRKEAEEERKALPADFDLDQLMVTSRGNSSAIPVDWFFLDPPGDPLHAEMDEDTGRLVTSRLAKYPTDPYGATFHWNRNYLRKAICAKSTLGSLGILDEFLYFSPDGGGIYPYYRHMRHLRMPSMFPTNGFGWRGREIGLHKAENTIRIAFVGASTTVNGYGEKYSYPEYVEGWLNMWAEKNLSGIRFEVINAGRTGIDSSSIAAIVRDEILPMEPDFVIYYEGSNQFLPAYYVKFPDGKIPPKPSATFRSPGILESHSAIAARALQVMDQFTGGGGYEPKKPELVVEWPADLNEYDPDPGYHSLPLQLDDITTNLSSIKKDLSSVGGELIISSFVWLAYEGMKVNLATNPNVHRYLNETYWPYSYKHIRRMADFQNRVFHNYSKVNGIPFIDVAKAYPQNPSLFNDAIHMTPFGVRVHAWIATNQLIPIIQKKIESGSLPRKSESNLDAHPGFSSMGLDLVTRSQLMTECEQQ
ncbi:MAG: hypothetical protein H6981_05725 [Gammaproteobacteria bacterium]|nr:hypothetical protein [Gammaproteobacteria bacterium]MCP5136281.1 hypothetical protein [Gammaproteobacteria bacterium]